MIREFSTKANPENNNARIAFSVLIALSAIVTAIYLFVERYKGLVGLAVMILLVSAIYIYTRYVGVQYYYDITFEHTGEPLFVVRRTVGKKSSTLARVALRDITYIKREKREETKSHKTPYGYRKYFYTPTLIPTSVTRIAVINQYEKAEIVVEISDEYTSLLSAYANEAREGLSLEDGE